MVPISKPYLKRKSSTEEVVYPVPTKSPVQKSLCISPDRIRIERLIAIWLTHLRSVKLHSSYSLHRLNADQFKEETFSALCRQDSLFNNSVFIWLYCSEGLDARLLKIIGKHAPALSANSNLLISTPATPSKALSKDLISIIPHIFSFTALAGKDRRDWIIDEFKSEGIQNIDSTIIEYLMQYLPESLDILTTIIHQIALSIPSNRPLTLADVTPFVSGIAPIQEYALLDLIATSNTAQLITFIDQLLSQNSSPFLLINLIARHIHTCLALKSLLEKQLIPFSVAAEQIGVAKWLYRKYQPLVERVSKLSFQKAADKIVVADLQLKGVSLSPQAILEEVCISLQQYFASNTPHFNNNSV
jgi:DNA polymerase III delta subunit